MQVLTRIPEFRYTQEDANLFRLRQLVCLMFLVSLRSMWRETEKRIILLHRRKAFPVAVAPPLAQIGSLALQQAGSYVTANRQQSWHLHAVVTICTICFNILVTQCIDVEPSGSATTESAGIWVPSLQGCARKQNILFLRVKARQFWGPLYQVRRSFGYACRYGGSPHLYSSDHRSAPLPPPWMQHHRNDWIDFCGHFTLRSGAFRFYPWKPVSCHYSSCRIV
jgi:hypothetical protein